MKRLQMLLTICCFILTCGCKQLPPTELSFCGFVLGGDFEECYEKASNNHQYEGLSKNQDGLLEHATFKSIELPYYKLPDYTISARNGKVDSYQGSIYSIRYEPYALETILDMYQAKYGAVKPRIKESFEYEYVRGDKFERKIVHTYYYWRFKNAVICLSERYRDYYGSKREEKVSVTYTDKVSYKKAKPYLDSLWNAAFLQMEEESEQNRIMGEEQKKEEERIKKEREKAMLESIEF